MEQNTDEISISNAITLRNFNVKLDQIDDQGKETQRFQTLGSNPRHHRRDDQILFESIKHYLVNPNLFIYMTTAK